MGCFFFCVCVFVFVKGAMFRVTAGQKANKHSQQGELVRQMVRAQLSCLRRSLTFGVLERCGRGAGEGGGVCRVWGGD